MKEVTWTSKDNSLEYKLVFIRKRQLKYTHLGKTWPFHTQCLIYENGLLKHFETIVKHARDEDNLVFAYRLVAEKCLKFIDSKWLRGQIREELLKELESLKLYIAITNKLKNKITK